MSESDPRDRTIVFAPRPVPPGKAEDAPVAPSPDDSQPGQTTRFSQAAGRRGADLATLTAPWATLAGAVSSGDFLAERLRPGQRVDRYEIVGRIGSGGMSDIYEARHLYLDQHVALKSVRADLPSDEVGRRFLREARVLASLSHPSVVQILDAGMYGAVPYIAIELLQGQTVKSQLAQESYTVEQALDVLEQMGDVLAHQEKRGIVHRDIKPSNVFARSKGGFCLFDYGISDLRNGTRAMASSQDPDVTQLGLVIGTPAYMSPEQARGDGSTDIRSDLFSLGLTVWECLAGESARSAAAGARQAATEPVPEIKAIRPDVPDGVVTILESLTAFDRADRYGSAVEFLDDLLEYRYSGRRPTGATTGSAFVAIPFSEEFEPVYDTVADTCLGLGLSPRRVDKLIYVDEIWRQIASEIDRCTLVVADLSLDPATGSPNPNVVTEAAHARALDKPLVIVSRDPAEALPFDWRHVHMTRYETTADGLSRLEHDLAPQVRYCIRKMSEQHEP